VIGAGRSHSRDAVLALGAHEFLDLEGGDWAERPPVDLVFDTIGSQVGEAALDLVRVGGTFVTIAGPPTRRPAGARAVFFVVEADRSELAALAQLVRDGDLSTGVGRVVSLEDAPKALGSRDRQPGKTVVRVRES
jgi:NADPH:quinone reductase-like Zn-dependent oxidoreductase